MYCSVLYFLTGDAQVPGYVNDSIGRLARKAQAVGPGERTGALVSPTAGSAEYLPYRQRWIKLSGTDEAGVWLGVDTLTPPKPQDLARGTVQPGHMVTMGDGNAWEIPVARLATGVSGLPRRRVITDDGTRAWQVLDAYQALSDFAGKVWELVNGRLPGLPDDEVDRMCGAAMAVNYRMGDAEAIQMGLFTDESVRATMRALVDWPTIKEIIEAEKKAASPITPGT